MAATIEITGTENKPKWVVNMAREYAVANGLDTLSIADFYETDAYKAQANRNLRAWDRTTQADINANR